VLLRQANERYIASLLFQIFIFLSGDQLLESFGDIC